MLGSVQQIPKSILKIEKDEPVSFWIHSATKKLLCQKSKEDPVDLKYEQVQQIKSRGNPTPDVNDHHKKIIKNYSDKGNLNYEHFC